MKKLSTLSRLGHGANDMYWFILPTVMPLFLQEYGFSYTQAGAFITAFLCAVAVMSFVMGRLADGVSRAVLIAGGFFLASGSLAAAGVMPTFALFMAFILLTAVGASTYHPVIYAMIDEAGLRRRGRMYSHFELFGASGVVILLLANGLLIGSIGPQGVVLVTCVPGLVMGGLFVRYRRALTASVEAPERLSEAEPSAERNPSVERRSPAEPLARAYPARAVRPLIAVFFASIVLRTLTATTIMNFMPTYLARGVGLAPRPAAFAAGLLFLGAVIANLFVGELADRYGPLRVLFGASLSSGLFLVASTYVVHLWMLPVSLLILGASISAAIPAQNLVLSALSNKGKKGTAFGALMGVMTTANALGPVGIGVVADSIGLADAFRLASIPVLASCVLVLVMSRNAELRVPRPVGRALTEI